MKETRTSYLECGNEITIVTDDDGGNNSQTKILMKGNQYDLTEITKTNEGIALVIYGAWERDSLLSAMLEHNLKISGKYYE